MPCENEEDEINENGCRLKKKRFSLSLFMYDLRVKLHTKFFANKKNKSNITTKSRNKKIFYYCMIALPLLQFIVFYIGVNFNSILLAFKKYDYLASTYDIVWFDNIVQVVKDIASLDYLKIAIRNSLLLALIGLAVGIMFSLFFSFYIYKKRKLSEFYRVFLFLPVIVSSLALVIVYRYFCEIAIPKIWEILFNKDIPGLLSNRTTELGTIIMFNIFAGFGVQILMFSSAMSGISDSIVDASRLDGVTPLKEFFLITLPLIYPTFITFFVVTVAGTFTNQMHVFSFYGMSAEYNVYTVGYFLYRRISDPMTNISHYPYLSAFGLVITIISVPLTLLVKKGLEMLGRRYV